MGAVRLGWLEEMIPLIKGRSEKGWNDMDFFLGFWRMGMLVLLDPAKSHTICPPVLPLGLIRPTQSIACLWHGAGLQARLSPGTPSRSAQHI